jgi:drug/metabolite transporter superfamily protein YnfA
MLACCETRVVFRTTSRCLLTATAEILGWCLVDRVLRQQRPIWLLIPVALPPAVYMGL